MVRPRSFPKCPDEVERVVPVAVPVVTREGQRGHLGVADLHAHRVLLCVAFGLDAQPKELLGTLLHEAAHGLGHAGSVRTTSRNGRYHNAKYRQLAEELGLEVAQVGTIGWSDTSVPAAVAERYRPVLEDLGKALVLWRRADAAGSGGGGERSRNLLACRCRCEPPRAIRVAQKTLGLGPITCGACLEEFERLDT